MSDVLEGSTAELPLDTAGKRALIEKELRENPHRSDRAIAQAVGLKVCHKTVGAARERLGIATPLGNSPSAPTEHRGAGDVVASAPGVPVSAIVKDEWDPFAPNSEDMVIQHQPAIAVYENTVGAVVIRQATNSDEDDPVIQIRPEHVEKVVARLRQVAKEAIA